VDAATEAVAEAMPDAAPDTAPDATADAAWPTDLVAHWSFDETAGALAHDDSGNGYHAHLVGAGQWVQDGRFGGALRLNRGDYLAVNGFQDASPGWTVSAWFRFSQDDDLSVWTSLVSNEIFSRGGWLLYTEPSDGDSNFFFEYGVNGSAVRDSLGCCPHKQPSVWYHFTAVVDDRSLTLYVGTESRATTTMSAPLAPGDPTLYIGRWSRSDVDVNNPGFFGGVIDDVSIFARALTAENVAKLDRASATSPP
jgi:hypothetical protein